MFTIDQIKDAHSKVKSGADFPQYVQDLIKLGVVGYDMFVADNHAVYFGKDGFKISSAPKYDVLIINDSVDKEIFTERLKAHQRGETDYLTFCKDCAAGGIEKWTLNMGAMTCTYFDKAGNNILEENIPAVH